MIFRTAQVKRLTDEVARSVVRALEAEYLKKPEAEANAANIGAVATFVAGTSHVPTIALRIGTLLLVKVTEAGQPSLVVTELTRQQLKLLEAEPELLTRPLHLLYRFGLESAANRLPPSLEQEPS